MRYFKLVLYTTGGEYETKESYIDESTFRQFQRAVVEGKDFIVLENKVIKRSLIKEIQPADEEVREYREMGVLHLLGLKDLPQIEGEKPMEGFLPMKDMFTKKTEMLSPQKRTEVQEEAAKEERKSK
mgnify:CR=1 FL=1